MEDEPLECRRCGLIASRTEDLCLPEMLLESCLDHSEARRAGAPEPPEACKRQEAATPYACAVCGRPALEPLAVCYPRRPAAAPRPAEGAAAHREGRRAK